MQPKTAPAVSAEEAPAGKTANGSPSAEAPPALPKETEIPDRAIVELLLEPKLFSMTPEEAPQRFAKLDLKRSQPLPDSLELVARTDTGLVTLGYFRDEGRWRFTHARLELPASTPKEAEERYQDLVALVREKLGKPREVKEQAPYFGQAFELSSELDAIVGAVATSQDARPHTVLSIVLPEGR